MWVCETKGQLNKIMNGHRFEINNYGNQILYLPDHSILFMKVRIFEKKKHYHASNNPILSTPLRRQRELHCIKTQGTAFPYGWNDKIDGVGNLSSSGTSFMNVLNLF